MTVAVRITVEPIEHGNGEGKTAGLYEIGGKNRTLLKKFTPQDPSWEGHIWEGRNLSIVEEDLQDKKPAKTEE